METLVSKWGNSLALRLPKEISASVGIMNGSVVNICATKSKIEITLAENKEISLDALLQNINAENIHKEITTGKSVGHELW